LAKYINSGKQFGTAMAILKGLNLNSQRVQGMENWRKPCLRGAGWSLCFI